jgi:hypothetical protein
MSEIEVEPEGAAVKVPWVVGASVGAKPCAPVDRAQRRERIADRISAQLEVVQAHVARAVAGGKLSQAVREDLEARVELDRKRAAWMRATVTAKHADLAARAAQLEADLGPEAEFLTLGVPRDRRQDGRLLEALAELSIVRFALSEAED